MVIPAGTRILFAITLAGVFAACQLDEPTRPAYNKIDDVDTAGAKCSVSASPLCRVENPQDTTSLTFEQKEELVKVIEAADDSARITITTVDVEALTDTSLLNETLIDLQTEILKDLDLAIDPKVLASLPLDSLLSTVKIKPSLDGTINLQWSGTLADVQVDMVSLNIKGNQFLGGYAVVEGKTLSFQPLGGDKIAIVFDEKVVWMGECPSFPPILTRTTTSFLTCTL